ncbi:MAG: saccharopine dehydrogenase NADP-binding domain-containing protein [Candidatus Marinimicrobia bacterium]|nr:saccharopine dehydrogenase NADP-binding domain-containing protein [Candidatus Neomarinimicrobiota bacterium]MCF7829490.1 saccharopine dehydrogenase NADP-binding domain-containing protein [Candidatus Neomarinimicrobiota bacterium]MCF7880112.1 saccharopine dehydrogenase NADP-binding domain-containing protein [Candidatus Neomarinimicrobiota bacterium]
MSRRILILGGYGHTGRLIADLLLQFTDARVVIAGRNSERAIAQADSLNERYSGDRSTANQVDATVPSELRTACEDVDFIINASGTSDQTRLIMDTILGMKIDYLDTQYSNHKVGTLESMRMMIADSKTCVITDGGFHPGLPAAMVRYAASKFDAIRTTHIGSVIRQDWRGIHVSESTATELADAFRDYQMEVYSQGKWDSGWTNSRTFDFGEPWGEKKCASMALGEMREIPDRYPSLEETGFYVAGFHWFVDNVVMMLGWLGMQLWPSVVRRRLGRLLVWSLAKTSKPPFGTIVQLDAEGTLNGESRKFRMRITHADGYYLTAAPVVACLMEYLDGEIGGSGLWYQANIVKPDRFFDDLRKMDVSVKVEEL